MSAVAARSARERTRRDLADGLVHHRAGRLAEAVAGYRRVLEQIPNDPDANHLMGLIALGTGNLAAAAGHFEQVVRVRPKVAEYRTNLGHALRMLGDLDGAERSLADALRIDPNCVDGWINLGLTRLDRGQVDGAIAALRTAVTRAPTSALAHLNLGSALQRSGCLAEAFEAYRTAATLAPDLAPAHKNLGIVAQLEGRHLDAVAAYRRAVALVPEDGDCWTNLGVSLLALEDPAGALVAQEMAVRAAPHLADGWLNRGTSLAALGRPVDAYDSLHRAVALGGGAAALTALGTAAAEIGRVEEAIGCHRRAIAERPDFGDAHWNLALALLGAGEIAAGFEAYEWRWRASSRTAPLRDYGIPAWRGEPVADRRILVWREQGLGDELLFLSCLPDLVAAGALVTVLVSSRLVGLVGRAFPSITVMADEPGVIGADARFDWQVPLGSLPRWLRRERAAFGDGPAWLRPDPAQVAKWRDRLAQLPAGRRVGVCWRSGLTTAARARHYAPLGSWGPVWRVPGVVWINLQYDECTAEIAAVAAEHGVTIHRWAGDDLKNDLESVVGLLAALDGVVTAPTAVSSLAGAVGTPTWELDSGSDWTVFGGERSPWFGSLRVVRKGVGEGGWETGLVRLATRLSGWTAGGSR